MLYNSMLLDCLLDLISKLCALACKALVLVYFCKDLSCLTERLDSKEV